jgi:glycosyltransferase involved in cell wall biosynthesis
MSKRMALAVPAWNAERYLPRLFESVRGQSVPFDEIFVYDDASTDGTARLAAELGATVVRTTVNTGPSIGKNELARRSSCEWIHFHDADDALAPAFVERALATVASGDADVLLFGTEDRDDATGQKMADRHWNAAAVRADAVAYCIANNVTNCGVYRREAFLAAGGFDSSEATKYNEDQAMHLRLALAGLRFSADSYVGTIIYRRMQSMSSGNGLACARAHYEVLRQVAERTGLKYAAEIGAECWKNARILGSYRDWPTVREALALAARLGCHDPIAENPRFRFLARVHPFGAVVAREQIIRAFKPSLRIGY